MAALQQAWEGQPDLTLPAFIGVLQNRGLSWGSSEDELLELLRTMSEERPALLTAPLNQAVAVTTAGPRLSVTLTPEVVVVRNAADPQRMPGVWRYASFRPMSPARPLVVTDTEGVEHRLGVVEQVNVVKQSSDSQLAGLTPGDIGARRWLLMFADGRRALLGQRLRLWETAGRETHVRTLGWSELITCAAGEDMEIAPLGGGEPLELGLVETVLLLEA